MEAVVQAAIARWVEAFGRMDVEALSGLYTADALFWGSTPTLHRGPDGVKAYFAGLPPMDGAAVYFDDVHFTAAGPDVINVAMTANFSLPGQPTFPMRMTHTLVRDAGEWRIGVHHASRKE